MKQIKITSLLILLAISSLLNAQNSDDYIEFNDRKNTVHGVYMGLGFHYGQIKKADTYLSSFKVAYVANQQFEIGFIGVGFYSDLNKQGLSSNDRDLVGAYGGLHLEPILFSKSKVNISFPVLIGGGAIGVLEGDIDDDSTIHDDDWDPVFVIEPGANILYNINRYVQLEAGVKYRFSSRVNFELEDSLSRINGLSVGIGVKIGVFNMGRNRYKKRKS